MMENRFITELTELIKIHLVNGSVLVFLKALTLNHLIVIIQSVKITEPADILLWLTILYTFLQIIKLLGMWRFWSILKIYFRKFKSKTKKQ